MAKPVVKADGPIVSAVKQAQRQYLQLRREGVAAHDASAEIVSVLRKALERQGWQRPHACEVCHDTGWVEIAVDVGHIYGPDEPVKWAVARCQRCDYWDKRWREYLERVQRVGSDEGVLSAGRTKGRR